MKQLIIEAHKCETHTFIYYLKLQILNENKKPISSNLICSVEQNPFDDCQTFSIKNIHSLFTYCSKQQEPEKVFKHIIYKFCTVVCKKQFVFNLRSDNYLVNDFLKYLENNNFSKIMSHNYISTRSSKMLICFYKINNSLLVSDPLNIHVNIVFYVKKSTD